MGMYPPRESVVELLPESLVADLGPANPPFNVRESKKVADELGSDPLPHGFTAIPVMSYDMFNINNIRPESCPFVIEAWNSKYYDGDSFSQYVSKVDPIRKPLAIALNLPEEVV